MELYKKLLEIRPKTTMPAIQTTDESHGVKTDDSNFSFDFSGGSISNESYVTYEEEYIVVNEV